ncbi:hypothetical protein CTRI78_v005679 [Colletotrichum trifolii]|uniref:Uncharacterized protein n=1 Tax=Colletotrichum trifolii TaxID=5466 RepID=A0A4R8RE79_COLTR|nr:hypothetical protein CTRI78_v005679 [Colletotrichum trifolii]
MPDLFDSKKMAYKFSRNFVEGLRKKFKIDRVTRLDIDELPAKELEKQRADRLNTCFNMHEISRHLIHSQETLNAAETMFMAILDSQQWKGTMATERFWFCHEFLINLKLRARAFVERLNNEIAHELHVKNPDQLQKV